MYVTVCYVYVLELFFYPKKGGMIRWKFNFLAVTVVALSWLDQRKGDYYG